MNDKNKIKAVVKTYGVAAIMGIAAFIGVINDKRNNDKIDELIDKVDKLESKED